jgi:hypothetical protein
MFSLDRKDWKIKANNMVLQIIPREHNLISITGLEKLAEEEWSVLASWSTFCRRNNFSFEQLNILWRNGKYSKSDLDWNNMQMFNFIDASLEYQWNGVDNDT